MLKLNALNRNLILLYLRQISAGLIIYQPVFYNFLISRGVTPAGFSFLLTAYNLGTLTLVIPAGYLADKFGRKWALMTANIAFSIGTLSIYLGHSMPVFILGEILYALAVSLDLGTHSAFLFEFLRSHKKEKEYYRYEAFGTFLLLALQAAGVLFGGFLAEKNLELPVLFTIALTAIGIPCAFLLNEPSHPDLEKSKIEKEKEGFSAVFRVIKTIFKNPGLRWAVALTVLWFWSRQFMNLYLPGPYFKFLDFPLRNYGKYTAILTLCGGIIAFFSRKFIQKPDLRRVVLIGLVLIPSSFAFMGFFKSTVGLSGFFLFAIPYGLCTAITNTLLNRQFSDHANRSTFLAVVDFCVRLTASGVTIWLGKILSNPSRGLPATLMSAASFAAIFSLILLPGVFKFAKDQNQ